jgi:hypothetical protein
MIPSSKCLLLSVSHCWRWSGTQICRNCGNDKICIWCQRFCYVMGALIQIKVNKVYSIIRLNVKINWEILFLENVVVIKISTEWVRYHMNCNSEVRYFALRCGRNVTSVICDHDNSLTAVTLWYIDTNINTKCVRSESMTMNTQCHFFASVAVMPH